MLTWLSFANSTIQDERAKREREKTKWTSVMDEIAKLKTQVVFPFGQWYLYSLSSAFTGNRFREYYCAERQGAALLEAGPRICIFSVPVQGGTQRSRHWCRCCHACIQGNRKDVSEGEGASGTKGRDNRLENSASC